MSKSAILLLPIALFPVLASAGRRDCRMIFLLSREARMAFEKETVYVPSLKTSDAKGIQNRLDARKGPPFAALSLDSPLNPETAMKLHDFIAARPFPEPLNPPHRNHWEDYLSDVFSSSEINQIRELAPTAAEKIYNLLAKRPFEPGGDPPSQRLWEDHLLESFSSSEINQIRELNPPTAMALLNFLVKRPYKGAISSSSQRHLQKDLEDHLSESFSSSEIHQMTEGIKWHLDQIEKMILSVDGERIKPELLVFETEQDVIRWPNSPRESNPLWIIASHSLIGPGEFYETIHKGKLKKARTKTGETLIVPQGSRCFFKHRFQDCSFCAEPHLLGEYHVTGCRGFLADSSEKQLVLSSTFKSMNHD